MLCLWQLCCLCPFYGHLYLHKDRPFCFAADVFFTKLCLVIRNKMPIKTCVTHKSAATFGFRYLCAILCKFEKYLWNGKRYQQLKNGIANYNLPLHGSCGQGMSGKVRENQSTRVQKLTKMQKKILTVVCRLHTMVECLFARFTRR